MVLRDVNIILILILALLLSLIPLTNDRFYIYIASLFMIYALFALSYNLLFGYAGFLSFGHAMFFAIGAYTTALFTLRVFKDPLIGLIVGVASSIPVALVFGFLTLRHTKVYFSILTLAFGMLVYAILVKWRSVTGGTDGLTDIPKRGVLLNISSPLACYFFILIFFVITSLGLYMFIRSRWGLLTRALGANEDRLPFTGHSPLLIRLYTFAVSGLVAALSGSLYSIFMGVITPDVAYWTFGADPLVMTLLGSSAYYLGPVLGAFILVTLTTVLARFAEYWLLLLGVTVIAVVMGFRGGVAGAIISLVERLKRSRRVRVSGDPQGGEFK
jgi:branched-chain amino acid transport system permease protein